MLEIMINLMEDIFFVIEENIFERDSFILSIKEEFFDFLINSIMEEYFFVLEINIIDSKIEVL